MIDLAPASPARAGNTIEDRLEPLRLSREPERAARLATLPTPTVALAELLEGS